MPSGSLVDGNPDDFDGNPDLLGLWDDYAYDMDETDGTDDTIISLTALEIYEFLQEIYRKQIIDTNYWTNDLDLIGQNITLEVKNNLGSVENLRIDINDGKFKLDKEKATILAGAKPGEAAFYASNGNLITNPDELYRAAYMMVNLKRGLTVKAQDKVNVQAGGNIYLNSRGDIKIETIKSTSGGKAEVRLKSGGGIYNAASIGAANIIGGNLALILEVAVGPLGTEENPLTLQLGPESFLRVRSAEDIYLEGIKGGSSTGGLNIDFIYTSGMVKIITSGAIRAAAKDEDANIVSGDLVIAASSIGNADNFLRIDLLEDGNLTATADGSIYLQEVAGDMKVDTVTSNSGDIDLRSAGSMRLGKVTSTIGNINLQSGGNIDLGMIESASGDINLQSAGNVNMAQGLIFSTSGNIYLNSSENIILGTIISHSGNINVQCDGSIQLGTISSDTGDIYLHALDSIHTDFDNTNPNIQGKGFIDLTAINGEIGSLANFLRVYTLPGGKLNATAKGNIYINGVGGDLYLGVLTSQNKNSTVYIITPNRILNGNLDPNIENIISNKAHIEAEGDIGAEDKYLITAVYYLEGSSDGDIWLLNMKALIVGSVVEETTGLTSGGSLHLIIYGKLTVAENITSHGELILTTQDLATEGQDIVINGGVTFQSQTASVQLQAGDNIVLEIGAILKAPEQVILRVDDQHANPASSDPDETGGRLDLFGQILAPSLLIIGQADNDEILISTESSLPNTVIKTGDGQDLITLDKIRPLTGYDGNSATITIDGEGGSDNYIINLVGSSNYLIIIQDSGTGEGDEDTLTINATANNDQILIRHNFIALINNGVDLDGDGYADVERINYNISAIFDPDNQTWLGCTLEKVILNTLAGDDHVLVDDTSTEFTINGGEGNDIFQIAQVFNSPRDAEAGVAPEDRFETVRTTQGYLSRGISFLMVINGEAGNDQFLVYHNKAELTVYGGDGDDKFLVRAFVVIDGSAAQDYTNIKTGGGINEITYAINAPVNIEGGEGYNTLVVLMTEYNDHIVITKEKIYSAGRTVSYANIQRLEIDGLAGDDIFYILSTDAGVETVLIGHLGNDIFIVGGDVPNNVINDENGNYINFTSPHNTSIIEGKLVIVGGVAGGVDRSLARAVTLPTETNRYIPTGEVSSSGDDTLTDDSINFIEDFSRSIENYFVGILDEFGQITQIRQIIYYDEHTLTLDKSWDEALIPGITKYVILPTSPTLFVDESTQVDEVYVYNDGSITSDEGDLTEDKLTGLNMGEGLEYTEIEKLFICLGHGNDTFNVQNTASGTYTEIYGNNGHDIFNLFSTSSKLVINGDAGNDTFNLYYYKAELIINGNDGNDYFNLEFNKHAKGNVILNGNSGDDYYNLEFSPEYFEYVILNGDEGDDTFSFADGVVLNGQINGGSGVDTLDYNRYRTSDYIKYRHADSSHIADL